MRVIALMTFLYTFVFAIQDNTTQKLDQVDFFVVLFIIALIVFTVLYLLKKYNTSLELQIQERTKELERQKINYEALYRDSADGILIMDDKKYLKANQAAIELLGYDSFDEFFSLSFEKLSPEYQADGQNSRKKAQEKYLKCLKEGSERFEWQYLKKDGSKIWINVTLTKIEFDRAEMIHVLWVDISRRKALEENLEKEVQIRTQELDKAMQAKSNFLANMSHEIRTPLNSIMGFADLLYREESDTAKQTKLRLINESGKTLLTIINDILDFSKLENQKLSIERIPFVIRDTFTQVIDTFYDKAKEKDITFVLDIDEALPKRSLGDSIRIKQVFSNLLQNAIKFSYRESQIKIKISYQKSKNLLYCEVEDSGTGIEAKHLEAIFSPFSQADASVTRSFGGAGLGLSISKAIIDLMGGELGVTSKISVGSCFHFTVPLHEVDEFEEDQEQQFGRNLDGHVLVVEDNKANQVLMTFLLDDLGLSYSLATDGLQAVSIVKKEKFDLILMDENMPNMNGIEATKHIKSMPDYRDVPIIAVTANALKGDKERFLAAGMDDYISKPIDLSKLYSSLEKFL